VELGTSAVAVALAYVLHQPDYVLPVVGTLSEDHLDEAVSASRLELSPAQLEWLESGALP
jgi:aryl-alcohol dehydrogenase-like predicted oxidoreductase